MPTTRRFSIVIHQKRVGRIQQTRSHVGPTRRRLVLVARRQVLRELVKRLTPMGKQHKRSNNIEKNLIIYTCILS